MFKINDFFVFIRRKKKKEKKEKGKKENGSGLVRVSALRRSHQ